MDRADVICGDGSPCFQGRSAALVAVAFAALAACGQGQSATPDAGVVADVAIDVGIDTGPVDACGPTTVTYGVCVDGGVADAGSSPPGGPCVTDDDCAPACCPCPEGLPIYSYAACSCGRCTSVCDPTNDYSAPICNSDSGASPVPVCLRCEQIINEALADGELTGSSACDGGASADWNALAACVATSCAASCPFLGPTSGCADCLARADAPDGGTDGGCATEMNACIGN